VHTRRPGGGSATTCRKQTETWLGKPEQIKLVWLKRAAAGEKSGLSEASVLNRGGIERGVGRAGTRMTIKKKILKHGEQDEIAMIRQS